MKFAIKIIDTGQTQNDTDDFEQARHAALSLSRWNIECAIVDESGQELKHIGPWKSADK